MNKALLSALALAMPGMMAMAVKPVEEANVGTLKKVEIQRTASLSPAKAASETRNTFFEGFEGRPEGYTMSAREWLPDGWQDVSKVGHTSTSNPHNLTWQVLDEESKNMIGPVVQNGAHEGYAFAYIMADVAYDGHYDLDEQDEWLITPSIVPTDEDWLYFKMFYNPGWTLFNRAANDFTGQNNSMEIYISEDGGESWNLLWSLIDDYIKVTFTDDELRASLIDITNTKYTSMYVNIHDYAGKTVKFAFRYFGSLGLPVALDNIAVGLPQPVASYNIPYSAFRQGISPNVTYPKDPKLYIPFGHEITWENTSVDVLRNEWSFADATGTLQTSEAVNLVTPAYDAFSVVPTPSLTGYFESNVTEPFQVGFKTMQAGGILEGGDENLDAGDIPYTGEFGVGYYDITEEGHSIRMMSEYFGFNPDIDLSWEKIQGMPNGSIDIDGIANMYFYDGVPYGFDYIDVVAYVRETFDAEAKMMARVFAISEDGQILDEIGFSYLNGSDLPEADLNRYQNIRFKFDVPVYVESNILVMITNPCRNENAEEVYVGNIVFPYVKSPSRMGNTLVYEWCYTDETGWYDGFFNMNDFPLDGGYFAGMLMNLGVSYSSMELLDEKTIDFPLEGGEETFRVKAHHNSDRWGLTLDGVSTPDWISYTATYDEANDTYDVTVKAAENPNVDEIDGSLYLVSPGSRVEIAYKQPGQPSGVESVAAADKAEIYVAADQIIVTGATGLVNVYDVAGALVAQAQANGERTAIEASHLAKGVYVVALEDGTTAKVVK